MERMRVHELRKTLAWYSRGLRGGADLRQQAGERKDAQWLLDLGERFFTRVREAGEQAGALTAPADPVAKSLARHGAASGGHSEAPSRAPPDQPPRPWPCWASWRSPAARTPATGRSAPRSTCWPSAARTRGSTAPASAWSAFGPAAIPQIETAMHTAQERGRLHLVATLQDIGDAEAIPILRHFAVYDSSDQVRAACESVLKGWSAATDARADRARPALARVVELRSKGEARRRPGGRAQTLTPTLSRCAGEGEQSARSAVSRPESPLLFALAPRSGERVRVRGPPSRTEARSRPWRRTAPPAHSTTA